jgi:hypothetical protein
MSDLSAFSSLTLNTTIGATHTGEDLSVKLIADVLQTLVPQHLNNHVQNSKNALASMSWSSSSADHRLAVQRFEQQRATHTANIKKLDKRASTGSDLFSMLTSFTPNQQKNHGVRFGGVDPLTLLPPEGGRSVSVGTAPNNNSGGGWGSAFKFTMNTSSGVVDSREYEDVINKDVLEAPICDLLIVQQSESIPDGFFRILKTTSNKKANLNSGSGGNPIYLCIKKDLTGQLAPIVVNMSHQAIM